MERNPYAPPVTQEVTPQDITFLRDAVPRPIAAWIFLIVLSPCMAFFAFNAARLLWAVLSHRDAIRSGVGVAVAIAWQLFLVAILLCLAIGIYRGARWARWLGVAAILAFAAFSVLRTDTTHYANEAQSAGGFIGKLFVIPLLFAWWAYAIGFSPKAKRYFSQHKQNEA